MRRRHVAARVEGVNLAVGSRVELAMWLRRILRVSGETARGVEHAFGQHRSRPDNLRGAAPIMDVNGLLPDLSGRNFLLVRGSLAHRKAFQTVRLCKLFGQGGGHRARDRRLTRDHLEVKACLGLKPCVRTPGRRVCDLIGARHAVRDLDFLRAARVGSRQPFAVYLLDQVAVFGGVPAAVGAACLERLHTDPAVNGVALVVAIARVETAQQNESQIMDAALFILTTVLRSPIL